MTFIQLLRATCRGEIIYFDGNGTLYEKHPVRSHYRPTNKFVYYEYYNKPLKMLTPCVAAVGVLDFDIDYEIIDADPTKIRSE